MASRDYYKPGDWNAICDRCGFKFKASQLKEEWTGLRVCAADFELRHPQDFLKGKPDKISVPWTRPDITLEDNLITTSSSEALGVQYLGETVLGGP